MNIRHLASATAVVGALALAGPALADDDDDSGKPKSPCPNGYTPTLDPLNGSGADNNGNGVVCARTTGSGDIFRDDRG
jgi:hypothetical protein